MLDEAFETARAMLEKHMDRLHVVAKELEAREKLTGEEFRILMEGGSLEPMEEKEENGSPGTTGRGSGGAAGNGES